MGRKIAIIGTAPTSLHLAPYNQDGWEIWACPGIFGAIDPNTLTNLKYVLEIHDAEQMAKDFGGNLDYFKRLPCALITRENIEGLNCEVYPLEAILQMFPRRYFTNTISYAIAYGIWLKAMGEDIETIGVWGVDMAVNEEYGHQRPSCEYFIGWAEGMGIEFILPDECDLCKAALLYGFETEQCTALESKYAARKLELQTRIDQLEAQKITKLLLHDPVAVQCPGCGCVTTTQGVFDINALNIMMQQANLQGCQSNMDYLMNQRIGIGL
ncbi:MAG: hypothetical protein WC364_10975 [Eubacteriales bacterium]|jgi:hypothetical protein